MSSNLIKIAIYSRKSKFTGKGESVENQIELCKKYIYSSFENIKEDNIYIFEDEGFSGSNTERPQFKEMMQKAKKKEFAIIVCYRLDRISRNIGDFAKLIEELNCLGISFISIKEQFDTSSPMGRAMMYIASVFSQLERETIAERIRDNMHELAKTGRWLGGITPTGYKSDAVDKITIDGKTKKSYKLTIISNEANLVKLIFKKFIETKSLTQTETYLIQNNYLTKNNKYFSRFAIKNILQNPVYAIADHDIYCYFSEMDIELFSAKSEFDAHHGIMAYNKTFQQTGKSNQIRNIDDWIIAVGKHNGLIRGSDWIAVQNLLQLNKSKSYNKSKNNSALLSGLLICKDCGSYMRPKLSQRKNTNGAYIYSYLCTLKERSKIKLCQSRNPNGNEIDALILNKIKTLPEDYIEFANHLNDCVSILERAQTDEQTELISLKKVFSDTKKEIHSLLTILPNTTGSASEQHIIKQINELDERCKNISSNIEKLESVMYYKNLSTSQFDERCKHLISFKNLIDDMTTQEKKDLIHKLIHKISWDGENLDVYFIYNNDPKPL